MPHLRPCLAGGENISSAHLIGGTISSCKKCILAAIFLISNFVLSPSVYAQEFPYDEYKTRTLSELVEHVEQNAEIEDGASDGNNPLMVSAESLYSAIRVEYVGRSRKVSTKKMELIKLWQKSRGIDRKVLTLIHNEHLFKVCDTEYWIPVQKQVADYFPKELKQGDKITLYLMVVGGVKAQAGSEFVFLTNEFKKY